MGNYSLEDISARAQAALTDLAGLAQELDEKYHRRKLYREFYGFPSVAVVGMGRAGKDTAAEYMQQLHTTHLLPVKSSSLNALPFVAHMIGIDKEVAYAERHQHREFWIEACNQLRANDLTRLARWCFGVCDIAVGLRGGTEFAACKESGVVDLSVWVDNNRVPPDKTVEFTRDDCDVVLENHGDLKVFLGRVGRLSNVLYRPRK